MAFVNNIVHASCMNFLECKRGGFDFGLIYLNLPPVFSDVLDSERAFNNREAI